MSEQKSALLRKIQGLLAKAESSPFSEEAQTYREKAEELMTIHAIEEFELGQHDPSKRVAPIKRAGIPVVEGDPAIRQQLIDLFSTLARHANCRIVYYGLRQTKGNVSATAVGYEDDIGYMEMLYTSLRMTMAQDLEPKYDDSKTKDENVRVMKEAGMKWERIAQLCDIPFPGSECITRYKRQCKRDGVEPIKANPINYVRNWAEGFNVEIATRLAQMKTSAAKAAESHSSGSLLPAVIRSKADEVNSMFNEEFKNLKYVPAKGPGKYNGTARLRGQESGSKADLGGSNRVGGNRGALGR